MKVCITFSTHHFVLSLLSKWRYIRLRGDTPMHTNSPCWFVLLHDLSPWLWPNSTNQKFNHRWQWRQSLCHKHIFNLWSRTCSAHYRQYTPHITQKTCWTTRTTNWRDRLGPRRQSSLSFPSEQIRIGTIRNYHSPFEPAVYHYSVGRICKWTCRLHQKVPNKSPPGGSVPWGSVVLPQIRPQTIKPGQQMKN